MLHVGKAEVGDNAQKEDDCHFYRQLWLNGLPRISTAFLGGDLNALPSSFFNYFILAS